MSDANTWAALVPPDAPEPQEGHIMTWGGWSSIAVGVPDVVDGRLYRWVGDTGYLILQMEPGMAQYFDYLQDDDELT